MPFVNPLDKLPQVPADWANHIVYGGLLGLGLWAACDLLELPYPQACAAQGVLLVASVKKLVDYVLEGESVAVCVGKALVTALWPASMAFVAALGV